MLWGFLSLATFFLTGSAAIIALSFAAQHKSHVLPHTALAYALLWSLLVIYSRTYRGGRLFFSSTVWFVAVLFLVFLCFIHLDDAPARTIYRSGFFVERDRAESLYWAVVFNAASGAILSTHLFWLRRKMRLWEENRRKEWAERGSGSPDNDGHGPPTGELDPDNPT